MIVAPSRLPLLGLCCAALALTACGDDTRQGTGDAVADTEEAADVAGDDTAAPDPDTGAPQQDSTVTADSADALAVDADTATQHDGVAGDTTPDGDGGGDLLAPLGGDRPASVFLPDGYDPATPAPLVILLHGYSATGPIQDLYLGFHAKATAAGFIAVVPDGTSNTAGLQFWNADPAWCCNYEHAAVDDAAYLLGVIAEAKTRFAVAPDRVYLVGHSNGGFMAYKMACDHADVIAGVVSIAGSVALDAATCAPSRPVTVLHVHGTLDAVIPYLGIFGQFPSVTTTVDRWVVHDGCTDASVSTVGFDYDLNVIGFETTRTLWSSCQEGAAVARWDLFGSLHVPTFTASFLPDVFEFLGAHQRLTGVER